jgi:hypothetical protein
MSTPATTATTTSSPARVFVVACFWVAFSLTAGRIAAVHSPAAYADLVQQAVTAVLLFGGFYLLARAAVPDLRPLSSVGFVRRPGVARELGLGIALGWAVAIALLLPAVLTGNFHLGFSFDAASIVLTLKSVVVLMLFALNLQLIVSGLPARLLLRIAGPAWTAAATILVAAFMVFVGQLQPGRNLLFTALAAALLSYGFLRTRAAWLPLGLQVGWMLSLQLLFGAASPNTPPAGSVVQSQIGGPPALTGGAFGPEASGFAVIVALVALVVLFRMTRDYAWHYTYQPITSAGYAMDIAPPAEHVREEKRAAAAAPLVQIGGVSIAPANSLPPDSAL